MSLMQELLDVISKENLATTAMLSSRLNVSPVLVELMLADLERAGYLRMVTGDCGPCTGCGPRQNCQLSRSRFWVRTDK